MLLAALKEARPPVPTSDLVATGTALMSQSFCLQPMEECKPYLLAATTLTSTKSFNPSALMVAPVDRADTPWTIPTLAYSWLVLTIFGHVPPKPILDTGAKHVMVGINFAKQIGLIGSKLHPVTEYITASGVIERSLGRSKEKVPIILAPGTPSKLIMYVYVDISLFTHYFFLLGNEFMGPMGGILDTWRHIYLYRKDWDT